MGDTLIISVQHPGEDSPINDGTILSRDIELLDLSGVTFNQARTVPRGSSWQVTSQLLTVVKVNLEAFLNHL